MRTIVTLAFLCVMALPVAAGETCMDKAPKPKSIFDLFGHHQATKCKDGKVPGMPDVVPLGATQNTHALSAPHVVHGPVTISVTTKGEQ